MVRIVSGTRIVSAALGLGLFALLCYGVWSLLELHREDEARRNLRTLYYDFAVAMSCSMVSETVGRGFALERDRLIAESGFDEAAVRKVRIRGWTDADEEWSNRGLGGFRAWCQSDGTAAVERFHGAWCGANPDSAGCE